MFTQQTWVDEIMDKVNRGSVRTSDVESQASADATSSFLELEHKKFQYCVCFCDTMCVSHVLSA